MNEELIIRFLQHDLTEEEKIQFEKWLAESSENMKLFRTTKQAWALTGSFSTLDDQQTEAEYSKFKYRYLQSEYARKSLLSSIPPFWRYAAVFIMASVFSFLLFKVIYKNENNVFLSSYNEIKTKPGEKTQITLADGSSIWINSCSQLKYPVNLASEQIDMYLEGEAYFDLKKLPNRKITIHTSRVNVNVLGTAFNLKSYNDDDIIETTLVRGQVALSYPSKDPKTQKQVFLSPNQTAIFYKKTNSVTFHGFAEHRVLNLEMLNDTQKLELKNKYNIVVEESVDTESQISWINGKFTFKKETFESLAKRLERHYNVKISILDSSLKKSNFSGTFDKESIEQALKALSYPVPFRYTIIKDSIIIQNK